MRLCEPLLIVAVDSEFSRKKVFIFGALVLTMLAIPVTIYTAFQQQDTQTKAADVSETEVIVAINGENITKADIRKVAEEQNDPTAVDREALLSALERVKERKMMDIAANNLGITPEQARLSKYKAIGLSDTEAKYEALKEQIILKNVNSIEAVSIGFWNPPSSGISSLSSEDQANASDQLAVGSSALDQIEEGMEKGDEALYIAEAVLTDAPELLPVLAINGYIINELEGVEKNFAAHSIIYEYGDLPLDAGTRDILFGLARNEIGRAYNTSDNRGGVVFKVTNKGNSNGYSSYNAWLTEQKASLIQNVSSL